MEKKGELIWEAPAGETVVGIAACGDSIVIATSARVYRIGVGVGDLSYRPDTGVVEAKPLYDARYERPDV